ncbi:MAG: GDSL-type esterase/lipase family protein [Pseudomonadota bacterium]
MRRWLARGGLALGGLLLALSLAEVGLRAYGWWRAPRVHPAGDDGAFHVLCIGDSFAYGLGSEDGRGPCEHLEDLLEAEGIAASATNRAVPGFNSSQADDALPAALIEARPDLVVVTVGHNNGWNFAGLHVDEGQGGLGVRLRCAFGSLRLVKLAEFWLQYDDGAAKGWLDELNREAKAGKRDGERAQLRAFHEAHPADVWTMVKLADLAREDGDRQEEGRWMEAARAADPTAVERALQGLRRVEGWHAQNASHGVESHLDGLESSRLALFHRLGQASLAEQQGFVQAVLRRDLDDIVARARAAGAVVVISGYPADKPANAVLAEEAAALGVPFVDQHADLAAQVARDGDPGHWFVLDGHCTSAGYRRVAENLLPVARAAAQGSGSPP